MVKKKIILELSETQLNLIQKALDLYVRIGILQLDTILKNDNFAEILDDGCTPFFDEKLVVGDKTVRGVVTKITKKHIYTKGSWGNGEEIRKWDITNKIKRSPDYTEKHNKENAIKLLLNEIVRIIRNGSTSSIGINSIETMDKIRVMQDMYSKIRHEIWKNDDGSKDNHTNASYHHKFSNSEDDVNLIIK